MDQQRSASDDNIDRSTIESARSTDDEIVPLGGGGNYLAGCARVTTLITSATYIVEELSAEFGHLPTAFLPIGHERLYDVQFRLLGPNVHLTLPESYLVPEADRERIEAAGALIIAVPDGLTLAESILFALEMIGDTSGDVRILHGDTIIYDLPRGRDLIAVAAPPGVYNWGPPSDSVLEGEDARPSVSQVMAGYFAFADGIALRRSLVCARGDFVSAVHAYRRDSPMRDVAVRHWLDCGHLQTYYRSRCSVRTHRAFNTVSMSFQSVEKRSEHAGKLAAESAWFEKLPPRLRLYTPGYLGRSRDAADRDCYAIEYLPIPILHELFVFGDLSEVAWDAILQSCFTFLEESLVEQGTAVDPLALVHLTVPKTVERLAQFFSQTGLRDGDDWRYDGRPMPPLSRIAEMTAALVDFAEPRFLGIMHGDLCFTNIAFDFRTQRIRVFDPRGSIDGKTPTIMGDSRYDLAKLSHSIVGAYDFVLANRYYCEGFQSRDLLIRFPAQTSLELVNKVSRGFRLRGVGLHDRQILAVTIHLFLSMLPLHADRPDRQIAFVANALRLFVMVDGS